MEKKLIKRKSYVDSFTMIGPPFTSWVENIFTRRNFLKKLSFFTV